MFHRDTSSDCWSCPSVESLCLSLGEDISPHLSPEWPTRHCEVVTLVSGAYVALTSTPASPWDFDPVRSSSKTGQWVTFSHRLILLPLEVSMGQQESQRDVPPCHTPTPVVTAPLPLQPPNVEALVSSDSHGVQTPTWWTGAEVNYLRSPTSAERVERQCVQTGER